MKLLLSILVLSIVVILPPVSPAATIKVPAEYTTIQEAIDAAADGDTILVNPGTYRENIDFIGKAVTVRSSEGPAVTSIDGGRMGSVVSFVSGEGNGSVLEGFTVTNGSGTLSGPYGYGGGIYCWFSTPTITGNVVTGNTANYHGGGIYCISADSFPVTYNTICYNMSHKGGGIYCSAGSNPTIAHNTIFDNYAELDGGALYCNWESNPALVNNDICANTAGYGGGGIYTYGSSPTVTSSILWGNEAPNGPEVYLGDWLYPSTLSIDHSDVEGGLNSIHVQPECSLDWGEGTIDIYPEFVLARKRDYRLLWGSPCIDAGHPDLLDEDGTRRDMGSHSFDQSDFLTLYLSPDLAAVPQGGELGVTYTLINRWSIPETFLISTKLFFPNGTDITLFGPEELTLPGEQTVQVRVPHDVPPLSPAGFYRYWSYLEAQPSVLLDQDSFQFRVIRTPVIHKLPVEW